MKKCNFSKKRVGVCIVAFSLITFICVIFFSGLFNRVEVIDYTNPEGNNDEIIDISEQETPMGSIKTIKATFYLNTTGKDSNKVSFLNCKEIGSGKLYAGSINLSFFSPHLGQEEIESLVCQAPDTKDYVSEGERVIWCRVVYSWFGYRVIGEVVQDEAYMDDEPYEDNIIDSDYDNSSIDEYDSESAQNGEEYDSSIASHNADDNIGRIDSESEIDPTIVNDG